MASVASELIEEVTAHAQSDSLEDAREIYADGTYFLNNLCICSFSCPQCKCRTCITSSYSCGRSMYWNGEVLTMHSLFMCVH